MTSTDGADPLGVEYVTVPDLVDSLTYAVESLSLGFERWDEEFISGPSLYFAVVTGVHSGEYADSLGDNKWPVDTCRTLDDDLDGFVEAARTVGFECDGAVIISADGTIQEQMVRIKSPSNQEKEAAGVTAEYADWMGTKHMSASEMSIREGVMATVTLSEEDGRVTVFENGDYDDYQREELGGVWRPTR